MGDLDFGVYLLLPDFTRCRYCERSLRSAAIYLRLNGLRLVY